MKNMKEQITKFNLEDAFKALDEIETPVVKGVRPNRIDLHESMKRVDKTDLLLEDYYDLNSEEELQEAQADRDEEIAKAKLARIEKIVDLDADSPEDIQPSYAGKFIIQCPQCMTMFYKDEADIEHSEEDPDTVNVGEVCQHCGNDSGYMLIGKVAPINNDEAANYQQAEEENNFEEGGEDKDLDVQPAEEEQPAEENNEEAPAEENNEELPADETNEENELAELEPAGEEENAEEDEEKKEEAFVQPTGDTLNEQVANVLNESEEEDLNKKLDEHNSYIQYLQDEIKKQEEALKNAKNEFVKNSIQKQIDALKADLDSAIPTEVKDGVEEEKTDLPTPEEAIDELKLDDAKSEEKPAEENKEAEVKESLTESDQDLVAKIVAHYGTDELSDSAVRKMLKLYVKDTGVKLKDIDVADFYEWVDDPAEFLFDFADDILEMCGENKKAIAFAQDVAFASKKLVKFCAKYCEDNKLFLDPETGENEKHSDDDCVKAIFDTNDEALKFKDVIDDIKRSYRRFHESLEEAAEKKDEVKLDDSDAAVDKMLDSKEFEKPISEEEVDGYISDLEAEAKNEEFDFNRLENLDEESINKHISDFLVETYSNVKDFEATNCMIKNNSLIVEGAINFTSGKVKNTAFTFTPAKNSTQANPVFEGLNEDLAEGKAFTLNCVGEEANTYLIVESIGYKYSINNNLVEGLK